MATNRLDDRSPLRSISPIALSSYARSEGWTKSGTYWQYSDVYFGKDRPEIIVPRTDVIDDYAMIVSDLISKFAEALGRDERSVHRDLTLADRDVMRVRALEADQDSLAFESTHALLDGTRWMLIAAAKSLEDNRPVHRPQVSGDVSNYLNRLRVGHTEGGSFSLILISPAVSPRLDQPLMEYLEPEDTVPRERRVAQRLSESLFAVRSAAESAVSGNDTPFEGAVEAGVSANLCEAVASLVESVCPFDVSFNWAMTRPTQAQRGPVAFSRGDLPILQEAARNFRSQTPDYGRTLYGFIYRMARPWEVIEGTVGLRTHISGIPRTVTAVLNRHDYGRAIEAHQSGAMVSLEGDLIRTGQSLHLQNARLVQVTQAPLMTEPEADRGDTEEPDGG